jgi:hypothetical protein
MTMMLVAFQFKKLVITHMLKTLKIEIYSIMQLIVGVVLCSLVPNEELYITSI